MPEKTTLERFSGVALRDTREAAGLTLRQLADAMEKYTGDSVGVATVGEWEREKYEPRVSDLLAIAKVLHKEPSHFFVKK